MEEQSNIHKPKLPFWILKLITDAGYAISVWGDLEELYTDKAKQQGRWPLNISAPRIRWARP